MGRRSVPLASTIAVAIVLAGCALGPTPSPAPRPTTGPTDPAPTPTPTAATPTPTRGTGAWSLLTSVPMFDVADLVSLDGLIVAAGCVLASGGCADASIAVLDSGQWIASTLGDDPARLHLAAIDATDAGLIAVGRAGEHDDPSTWRAAALISTDGRVWRAAPNQGSFGGRAMMDVAELPGEGWVAVGTTVTPTVLLGFDSWFSRDGLAWELTASQGPAAVVRGVVAFDGGLIAWGTDCVDTCGPPTRATLWTSADGRTWTRVPEQPSLTSAGIDSVIPTAGGALAVGSVYDREGSGQGVVWATADGSSWTRTLLPDAADHQSFRIIRAADGVVVVGVILAGDDSLWRTWHSPDGASWTRVPGTDVAAERMELVNQSGDVLAVAIEPTVDHGRIYVLRLRIE